MTRCAQCGEPIPDDGVEFCDLCLDLHLVAHGIWTQEEVDAVNGITRGYN